jgi:hypothetical protein
MPASEVPLWRAWMHIEPFGWQATDYQFARLSRRLCQAIRPVENPPGLEDYLTPEQDWRAFDPEKREEMEADRLVRNLKSVMRGEPDGHEDH